MQREQIVFVGTSDLSGHFRGKSFPAMDLPARLHRGVGMADGAFWDFCPRHVLRRALDRLKSEAGLKLFATFEQEFLYSGVAAHPPQPYELDAYRRQGNFGEALIAALRQAGLIPDSFLSEFGPQQYEITSAPSVPSYYRLRPNGWAPVRADVAALDRGAALRICPLHGSDPEQRGRQFNVEFRVADATASPYLALAMLVQAGLDGIRERRGIGADRPRPLPDSLGAALTLLENTSQAAEWFGADLLSAYLLFKRAEVKALQDLEESEVCRRYAEVY
jgi:glutamine synthetase